MKSAFRWAMLLAVGLISSLVQGCGGGGGGGDAPLLVNANSLFTFTPNQPIDVVYACQRVNSQLLYTFDLKGDGTFDLYSTLDTGQDVMFSGVYTYQNDQLHLQSQNPMLPLDEVSTHIEPQLGMVYRFQTNAMECVAIGHRYNDVAQEFVDPIHYTCPNINIQPVSYDSNAIEFVHRNMPFNLAVPGSAFRQRDRHIQGTNQPNILRGYGIYRRTGDTFYVYFNDLFDDANLLTGSFLNGELQITVDQLEPSAGNCTQ